MTSIRRPPSRSYATFLGYFVQQYEPIAWAEELIEPALAVDHPRLAQLYLAAGMCYMAGRTDDFVSYIAAARRQSRAGASMRCPSSLRPARRRVALLNQRRTSHRVGQPCCYSRGRRIATGHCRISLRMIRLQATMTQALALSDELFAASDSMRESRYGRRRPFRVWLHHRDPRRRSCLRSPPAGR